MGDFNSPGRVNSRLRYMVSAMGLSRLEQPPQGAVAVALPGSVFVAIDFENVHGLLALRSCHENDINAQMGIAILDPVHLKGETHPSTIQSIQFASGHEAYIRGASRKFLFGETVVCKSIEFAAQLASLLPSDRPFLLVAQKSTTDRAVLRNIGLDIDNWPQLAGIVDTYPMSGDVFHTGRAFGSLAKILTKLGIGWNRGDLHSAGNDAHYTLRAAILLAERGYLESCPSPDTEDAIIRAGVRTLALAPVPERKRVNLAPARMVEIEAREEVKQARVRFRAEQALLEMEMEKDGSTLQCLSGVF